MFSEINYFKQFLWKIKITCTWPVTKIYLVVHQVNSTSLIHCSSTKIHNNTYKMSTPVKELTVCQNTFNTINKQERCIIKHLNDDDARCLPPPTTIIQPPSPQVVVVLHRLVPYRSM